MRFTNKYIFIYTAVLVIIVAFLLSMAATLLQPAQEVNAKIEKMQNILSSAGITASKEQAESDYKKYITQELLINSKGEVCGHNAFSADLKTEMGKPVDQAQYPLFVCEQEGVKSYIIPLLGKGLWGPIWGYLALKDDMNTVIGVVFDHKGETPGLGAEIGTPDFEARFMNKELFSNGGEFVSVEVVKGGIINSNIPVTHAVDALSGATITCKGVSAMIRECLSHYIPYIENQIENSVANGK